MRRLASVGLLSLGLLSAPAAAYPIPPQTLFDLTRDADLVVLARVVKVDEERSSDDDWVSHVALLEVIETWKGTPLEEVRVSFSGDMVCPAPPAYLPGRRVAAFLKKSKKGWYTVGLSYGTRYPVGRKAETALAEQVKRTIADPDPSIDRALDAVAERETRWDGLYLLDRQSDPAHAFYDRKKGEALELPPRALDRLEQIMVAAPSFDSTLPQMLRLLKGRPSPAVTAAAADAIETVLHDTSAPYWMDETLDLFAERLGHGPAPAIVPADPVSAELALVARSADESRETREERVQLRWDQLKRRAKLTPKVLADFRREEWTGTGGQTPP